MSTAHLYILPKDFHEFLTSSAKKWHARDFCLIRGLVRTFELCMRTFHPGLASRWRCLKLRLAEWKWREDWASLPW